MNCQERTHCQAFVYFVHFVVGIPSPRSDSRHAALNQPVLDVLTAPTTA
jgi:hypothetical protein